MKYIKGINEFLNESLDNNSIDFDRVIFNPDYYYSIFEDGKENHGRISDRFFIVKFYLAEYLKVYTLEDLKFVKSWGEFKQIIHSIWESKKINNNQKIVFRRGGYDDIMFFF